MKGQSPFDLSQKRSPGRQSQTTLRKAEQPQEQLPSEAQYRLERVLEEARNREQRYIAIIKEQEDQRKEEAQHYLSALKAIKEEFISFMDLKKGKKQKKWRVPFGPNRFDTKKQANRLNSLQFSLKTLSRHQLQSSSSGEGPKMVPHLSCRINFYYFTSLMVDCMRQTLPEELILTLRTVYPHRQMSSEIKIVKQEDQVNNLNCLFERIPFQIATLDNRAIIMEFSIPCEQEAINYYREREFQVQLIDKKGMFVYGYSKLNLYSLLYYQQQPTEWQLKPIVFYSPLSGSKIGTMSLKLSNKLYLTDKQTHYKIQSNTPMQPNTYQPLLKYNDQESRMIQRISKFKTNHNSLLLGIGSSLKEANAERYFENENDKIVLMHRKKKELQSIQQYKNSHKEELMNKLFNEAIDKYYLVQCQIGCPKYVTFNYFNNQREHKRIHLKCKIELTDKGKNENIGLASIQESIFAQVVKPEHFKILMQKELIKVPSDAHYQYNMEEEGSMWAMSGMSHPIVVRILSYPPKQHQMTPQNLNHTYNLTVTVSDQYDRQLDIYHSKIRLNPPHIQHKLYLHGVQLSQQTLEIPFEENQDSALPKSLLSNNSDLEYQWNQHWNEVSCKVKFASKEGEKSFYIIVNDSLDMYQISSYQIVLYSYPKLSKEIRLVAGEVEKIKLDFLIDTNSIQDGPQQKIKSSKTIKKEQLRLLFVSSKPEHCYVRCQNEEELICKTNKVYQVQARLQTFDQTLDPQKIIIHAMDLDRNLVIKRWLLQINKEKEKYEKIHKLHVEHGRPLKYKFEMFNNDSREKIYRLYSSNLGIMSLPMHSIAMLSNQVTSIDIEFHVKQQLSNQELGSPLKIVLTVTDGTIFMNYLFELIVKIH